MVLERTHFTIGRAAEYFDARELAAQTGRSRHEFAAVVLKELIDNALDAAEAAGVAPAIDVVVDRTADELTISVADNGPGLPPAILDRILDFDTRTSDKRAYVRGDWRRCPDCRQPPPPPQIETPITTGGAVVRAAGDTTKEDPHA